MGSKQSHSTKPDPNTGLSARDRHLIQKSWAEISDPADVKGNAIDFFVQLFQRFPHMKKYFSRFGDFDESKFGENPALRAHALGVMTYLTAYVQHLNDAETLVALVQKLADAHIARGITLKDFQDLASMFPQYLRYMLGKKRVTPELEEAWVKLLGAQSAIFEARVKAMGQA